MRFTRISFRKVGIPLLFGVWTAVILSLGGCNSSSGDGSQIVPQPGPGPGGSPVVSTAPRVTSTVPAPTAIDVGLNTSVTATFSGTIDPTSITDNTFYLQTVGGTDHVSGTLSYVGGTAKFTPSSPLSPSTSHLATVTGVRNLAGVAMEGDTKWIFSTSSSSVSAGPTITATTPSEQATNVSITAPITFTFSEDMDPSTLVAGTTVKLQTAGGGSPVAGTVSYTGVMGKFTPSGALAPETTYLFTVTTGVLSRFGIPLAQTKTLIFTTASATGPLAPAIDNTSPIEGAGSVAITDPIIFTFNQDIDPSTLVVGTTVKLQTAGAGASVAGTVSYTGVTGKFTPSGALAPETTYLFTVTTGVLSRIGIPLAQTKTLIFTTSTAAGPVAPAIDNTSLIGRDGSIIYGDGSIDVGITTPITFRFNQDIDPSTLVAGTTVILQSTGGGMVSGMVSYTGTTGKFTPNAFLAPQTTYIFTVTTGVKNRSGISMSQKFTLVFTTSASTGPVSLAIIDNTMTPSAGDNGVVITDNVMFTFNQDIDPSTLRTGGSLTATPTPTVYLQAAGPTWVSGTVTLVGRTATFAPAALSPNTTYVFTVTTGVKNLSGVGMAQEYKWIFTTVP